MRKWIAGLLAVTALSSAAGAQMDGRWRDRDGRGGPGPRTERNADDDRPDIARPDRSRGGERPDARPDRRPDDGPAGATLGQGGPDRGPRDGLDRAGPAPGFAAGRPDRDRPDRYGDRGGLAGEWRRPDQARGAGWNRERDDWTRSRFDDRAGWNRGWRDDRRYDWNRYRTANRGAYRLPRYYAPGGWNGGYRRVGIGVGLQVSLWSRNYWIADPYAYRLPRADGPYRWIRYYDDALLVDLRRGVVVDAVYGIFW